LNPGSTNKYTKFGQLIIRKFIIIIATRCHFKAKMLQIRFQAFVCPSVRPSVRWSLTLCGRIAVTSVVRGKKLRSFPYVPMPKHCPRNVREFVLSAKWQQ